MIETMKKVTVFSIKERREAVTEALRAIGVMHIESMVLKSEGAVREEEKKAELEKVLSELEEVRNKKEKTAQKSLCTDFEETNRALLSLSDEKRALLDENSRLLLEKERLEAFGNLEPSLVRELEEEGIELHFYSIADKDYRTIRESDEFTTILLKSGKQSIIMSVNSEIHGHGAIEFSLGNMSLESVSKKIDLNSIRLGDIRKTFSSYLPYEYEWRKRIREREDNIRFENVKSSAAEDGEVLFITGYIPEKFISSFKDAASSSDLAYLIDDISDEDNPPTLVRYPGFVRIIKPVFDILGVVPGYREYDISTYFLLFFSLFFAMIIGDAGYGLVFLLAAIAMHVKNKKASDINILLYVLSFTTMLWGVLTGTYFGSEAILVKFSFLQKLVVPAITNFPEVMGVDADWAQNMLMKFCFILGAVQLSLACVLNIIHKIPKKDLSWLADLGWLIDIVLLYLLVLYLVIGASCPFTLVIAGVATGFVLVCCFSAQGPGIPFVKGLVSGLGGFFTTFLNTVSCMSNIMSYIRLFAVGMASLAIAQSFNDMGAGFMPLGLLVIILGHVLNIVMGLLSVIVHGVRLNLLEFSGQLGIEWSGYEYDPFKKVEI